MRKISAIKSSIKTLGRNTDTVRNKVHALLCEVAGHAYEHGDVRLFDDILAASKGLNIKEMVKWINANGFARITKDGAKVNKQARKDADFANGDEVTAYLMEQPQWHETEDSLEQVVKELDAIKRIQSLRNQITKEGTVVKHVDFQKLTEEVQGLMEDMQQYA